MRRVENPKSEIRNPSAQARVTRLNQPNRHPAPTNPKSEIRNPKFRMSENSESTPNR
jgi:hypothetical protein